MHWSAEHVHCRALHPYASHSSAADPKQVSAWHLPSHAPGVTAGTGISPAGQMFTFTPGGLVAHVSTSVVVDGLYSMPGLVHTHSSAVAS